MKAVIFTEMVTQCDLVKFHHPFKKPAVFIINPDDESSYLHRNGDAV
jgi:hypothetical protein